MTCAYVSMSAHPLISLRILRHSSGKKLDRMSDTRSVSALLSFYSRSSLLSKQVSVCPHSTCLHWHCTIHPLGYSSIAHEQNLIPWKPKLGFVHYYSPGSGRVPHIWSMLNKHLLNEWMNQFSVRGRTGKIYIILSLARRLRYLNRKLSLER